MINITVNANFANLKLLKSALKSRYCYIIFKRSFCLLTDQGFSEALTLYKFSRSHSHAIKAIFIFVIYRFSLTALKETRAIHGCLTEE